MKLLGLRLCEHDSNMSYFDGKKVYYFKSERKYNVKHHAYNDLITWVDEIKKIWNLFYKLFMINHQIKYICFHQPYLKSILFYKNRFLSLSDKG